MPLDIEDDELEGLTEEEKQARRNAIGTPIYGPRMDYSESAPSIPEPHSVSEPAPSIGSPINAPEETSIPTKQPPQPKPGVENVGGIGGKILRGMEMVGSAIFPNQMALVPGTHLHQQAEINRDLVRRKEQAATAEESASADEREAMAERARAQAEAFRHPQAKPLPEKPETLLQEYADAVKAGDEQEAQRLADAITSIQKPAAERIPPTKTTVQGDGKVHIMERDPKTGQYSIDRGIAPATYGQIMPETKTTELLGPDGVMHRFQFDEHTGGYTKDMGPAPTGAAAHSIFQAGAIERVAPGLIDDINSNRELLGHLTSYYKQWLAGTPVADPKAAQLMSELMSFAALQPALHGFRAHNAMEAFEKIIGGLAKDPDATIGSIQGILKTATTGFSIAPTTTPAKPKVAAVPKEEMTWDAKQGKYVKKEKK